MMRKMEKLTKVKKMNGEEDDNGEKGDEDDEEDKSYPLLKVKRRGKSPPYTHDFAVIILIF